LDLRKKLEIFLEILIELKTENLTVPIIVEGEKDEPDKIQSLKLDALVAVLTKAIQEQQETIELLQKQNSDLLMRIENLEKMNGIV